MVGSVPGRGEPKLDGSYMCVSFVCVCLAGGTVDGMSPPSPSKRRPSPLATTRNHSRGSLVSPGYVEAYAILRRIYFRARGGNARSRAADETGIVFFSGLMWRFSLGVRPSEGDRGHRGCSLVVPGRCRPQLRLSCRTHKLRLKRVTYTSAG